ncbi:MAG: LPXTG cell wall anchor domain-containing protein [Acidimicrobiales bacterium]
MRKLFLGALLAGAATFGVVLPASAEDCAGSGSLGTPDCGGVIVEGGELVPTPQPVAPSPASPTPAAPTTPSAPATQPSQATLPVTGTETATLALAGVALVGGGAVLVTRSRRATA